MAESASRRPAGTATTSAAAADESEAGSRDEGQRRSIAAVERAIDVLLLFGSSSRASLGVTEISAELGLSKAAVHRILTSLRGRELIVLDPETRRYALGPAAVGLGNAYLAKNDVRSLAAPELAWLCGQAEETATLSIRNGDTRIYLDQVVPAREVRMEVAVGVAYPLHAGGSSKAFLAFLAESEIDAYLDRNALDPMTDRTLTDAGKLRRELAAIRKRGYATSVGERQSGAASVAAPVFDHDGRVAAVLSVSGPAERFKPRAEHCAKLLLEATARLSARLGYAPR
ncbi:IclR family transcriptional regulator [Yinghuangia soli]|uniref:IclR family transcriptional regulator n=1 Tax=Yinghuangia soli TaxID=2908204 RepID=A0AA41Q931_9ACTN|nr:IclR family transcriptional regulator [Yinghuangia soli]MCF2533854.1 IclR family transcriptional regulator [Yinghuangia soli]